MRRFIAIAIAPLVGATLGVVAASHVWLVSSRLLREATLAEFMNEQGHLANRARREGDAFREAVHRINLADAQAEVGFRWLQRARNATYWERFTSPWTNYWLVRQVDVYPNAPKDQRGRALVEARYRAQAAIACERVGWSDLAALQWARAVELQPAWSVARHREESRITVSSLEGMLEPAFLQSTTYSELESALAKIRVSLKDK